MTQHRPDAGTRERNLYAAVPRLHRWYRRNARELPWRRTTDPYAIWISEVMLQQTQVATVIPYYERWLVRFPDVGALAVADENDVLLLWEGLGYYSRARNLHGAARQVMARHGGVIPADPGDFRALSGVGPYTAAAVLSIAFGAALAVLDGNVKRVLARLIELAEPVEQRAALERLQALAQQLLRGEPGDHNQAMMELGATVCLPRRPRCESCPFEPVCAAAREGDPTRYPRKARRAAVPHHDLAVALVCRRDDVLLYRRPYGGMLAGLWDLPTLRVAGKGQGTEAVLSGASLATGASAFEAALTQMLRDELSLAGELQGTLPEVRHAYTHLKVTLHPYCFRVPGEARLSSRAAEQSPLRWVPPGALAQHPLPRATQKVLAAWRDQTIVVGGQPR